ncbi:MAG: ammonia channel protein, partial [Candidatus Methylomirabilis sp.]
MPNRLIMNIVILLVLGGVLLQAPAMVLAQQAPPPGASSSAQAPASAPPAAPKIDSGDTAWMLTSSALVLLMTAPGLALFYAGLVRRKNALGTIMQSFIALALISIQWVLFGYSLAFS